MVTIMDANIKNVPNKVSTIATGLSTQYGATGSCAFLTFAWCCSGVCFHANRPHNNKNAPIRKNNMLYNYLFLLIYANTTSTANMMMTIMCIGMPNNSDYLFRKKNLTLMSIQIAVKIYSSKSLNGALMWIGK
jgi:hypothetical protein